MFGWIEGSTANRASRTAGTSVKSDIAQYGCPAANRKCENLVFVFFGGDWQESETPRLPFSTGCLRSIHFHPPKMSSSSKRTYAETLDNDNGNDELEDGEELEVTDLVPPPPPPVLRLVVYHSSAGSSADLLPSHQTLAIVSETTSIGRDRSYDPRIRLKSLEVSKTHATLYYNEQDGDWCILDNASTHGSFVRKEGEQTYTRLSDKGATSLPRVLKHLE